jgi:hypothetical protein
MTENKMAPSPYFPDLVPCGIFLVLEMASLKLKRKRFFFGDTTKFGACV